MKLQSGERIQKQPEAEQGLQHSPSQFCHSHSNQWHFMCEGQINTGKLFGDGSSERCGEGRICWVKVLWRESLAGIAWQNYTSLLTLRSLDFHIYLWLFFFKPWALLTWESCCVKRYWLEFLISCHYSMTIGEWNVFYFFHHGYASSAWDAAITQTVSSRHFQLKIFAVWAKRRICPRSKPQCVVPGIRTDQWQSVFWGQRFPEGWLTWGLSIFRSGLQKAFFFFFLPEKWLPFAVLPAVFPPFLVWCSKKWRKSLKA